jgi:hypothetical protein
MKQFIFSLTVLLLIGTLVGCSAAPSESASQAVSAPAAVEQSTSALLADTSSAAAPSSAVGSAAAGSEGSSQSNVLLPEAASSVLDSRKIIRNAYLRVEAQDVLRALNTATRLSEQVGGYIVNSRTWRVDALPYATLSFAVPVERFEEALTQSRTLGELQDENITSQDVTGQFVDLEARITNLEATAARIRSFLDETKTVAEALNVNRELSTVESELEVLKGQRNTLAQQTSFSTVNIDFIPVPPVVTTGEVLETVQTWSPVRTFNDALDVLLTLARAGIDVSIWVLMIGLPVLLILGLLWWIVRRLFGIRLRAAA